MFSCNGTFKRVAAYCRVSTDRTDQKNSFESQKEYFKKYVQNHSEWILYEIYTDEGITGTNTKKRKGFLKMIEDAENHCFDLLITKEISRFARNILDSVYYTRMLKQLGIGVFFLNDNIFTLDSDAELRLAILASIAQEESRKTSERVKWGQMQRMKKGVVFGRNMLGYDVKNGKMTVNPKGAEIVKKIFYQFTEENLSVTQIARNLDECGILPMYAKKWNPSVVLRILKNEKYKGDLKQKKTYTPDYLSHDKKINRGEESFVWIYDHHEPIVTEEIFEKAAKILSRGKNSLQADGKYPFSGKIICGVCGKKYTARFQTSKSGFQYRFWRCNSAPHANKRTLHSEDMIRVLSELAVRKWGIQTSDEKMLASFLSKAVVLGDSLQIYLFGESNVFSFRYILGTWVFDSVHEKENTSAQKERGYFGEICYEKQ
ncbi:MAG: recombinase family protein [Ruminococcaceae bacterium]|nr:recombinase family protein [Oscillospiraceae bacterium]